ncbi:MAG: AsnC family transcriptional regulator [Alphaproteobacteria bacterium]|nr:AsnC family transcriptional regulator [Alphaproteobacteria bacterium]
MKSFCDEKDASILAALERDGRLSYRALGRAVGLSTPAAAERVRRLTASGAIRGFGARIDRAAAGRPVTAYLSLTCPAERGRAAIAAAEQAPEILECHRIAGAESLLLKAAVADLAALDRLVERFRLIAPTRVTVVLSTQFEEGEDGG